MHPYRLPRFPLFNALSLKGRAPLMGEGVLGGVRLWPSLGLLWSGDRLSHISSVPEYTTMLTFIFVPNNIFVTLSFCPILLCPA